MVRFSLRSRASSSLSGRLAIAWRATLWANPKRRCCSTLQAYCISPLTIRQRPLAAGCLCREKHPRQNGRMAHGSYSGAARGKAIQSSYYACLKKSGSRNTHGSKTQNNICRHPRLRRRSADGDSRRGFRGAAGAHAAGPPRRTRHEIYGLAGQTIRACGGIGVDSAAIATHRRPVCGTRARSDCAPARHAARCDGGRRIRPALAPDRAQSCAAWRYHIHASLLPRWRGAAPVQRAIAAGDTETGISLMQMDAGLDTGPVLCRTAIPIHATDTAAALTQTLTVLGAQQIVNALKTLQKNGVLPKILQPAEE